VEALGELQANAGTQFDPQVVEVAVDILAARERRLRSVTAA
jgi:HD-GYP domain-containing protein (c-di-GMP phosphodiesterase class II)